MGEKLLALQNFRGDTDSIYLLKIYERPVVSSLSVLFLGITHMLGPSLLAP